jgi:hypothetical protein
MKVHEAKVVIFNLHTLFLKIAIAKILEGALGGLKRPHTPAHLEDCSTIDFCWLLVASIFFTNMCVAIH